MKRAGKTRAVVFDLDGTLLDSLPLVLAGVAHAIEPFGPRPKSEIFAKLGGPPDRFLSTLLDDERHVPLALERLVNFHRDNWTMMQPFEGAIDFLRQLQGRGLQLAIWTGRDRSSGAHLMQHHSMEGLFETLLYGDDLPTHKPDPAGLSEILKRLGVTAAEAIYVGDADVDVLGGVGCGVDTLLIDHGREIDPEVRRQAWASVTTPQLAYSALLRDLG